MSYTQTNQIVGTSAPAPSKPKSSSSDNGGVSFLKTIHDRFQELSKAMADENAVLNLPELGMYDIKGADKFKTGTVYGLQIVSNDLNNLYTMYLNLFTDNLKILYDKPTQLLNGGA